MVGWDADGPHRYDLPRDWRPFWAAVVILVLFVVLVVLDVRFWS